MSLDLGKRAICEAAKTGIREVALYTTGEPLLYPYIEQLIVTARENNMYCFLTSNGMLLNKQLAKVLCKSGLDSFKFSIDGTSKEEYESIREGGIFDILMNNIQLLRETRDRLGSKLKIICGMVLMERNQENLSKFRALFEPIADDILISNVTNLGGKYKDTDGIASRDTIRPRPCRLLWDRIIINYDGTITACCVDFDSDLVYSDYNNSTLLDAWNNELIQDWRENHLTGRVETMPLCCNCDAPYVFDTGNLIEIAVAI
jgi:molybdenum cofactor biosynthesis enzyme MoaA